VDLVVGVMWIRDCRRQNSGPGGRCRARRTRRRCTLTPASHAPLLEPDPVLALGGCNLQRLCPGFPIHRTSAARADTYVAVQVMKTGITPAAFDFDRLRAAEKGFFARRAAAHAAVRDSKTLRCVVAALRRRSSCLRHSGILRGLCDPKLPWRQTHRTDRSLPYRLGVPRLRLENVPHASRRCRMSWHIPAVLGTPRDCLRHQAPHCPTQRVIAARQLEALPRAAAHRCHQETSDAPAPARASPLAFASPPRSRICQSLVSGLTPLAPSHRVPIGGTGALRHQDASTRLAQPRAGHGPPRALRTTTPSQRVNRDPSPGPLAPWAPARSRRVGHGWRMHVQRASLLAPRPLLGSQLPRAARPTRIGTPHPSSSLPWVTFGSTVRPYTTPPAPGCQARTSNGTPACQGACHRTACGTHQLVHCYRPQPAGWAASR